MGRAVSVAERFIARAKSAVQRIVFPEGADPRMLRAVRRLRDEDICAPILVGDEADLRRAADDARVSLEGIRRADPAGSPDIARYAAQYAARRGVRDGVARRVVAKPLAFAAAMVSAGDADGMVGGVNSTTASLLMAAGLAIGYAEGIATPSSLFIMEIPNRLGLPAGAGLRAAAGEKEKVLIFADCALNVDPTPAQLADIAIASARNAVALLGIEPRVAMLSFANFGASPSPQTDKVRRAAEMTKAMWPELVVDGEMQVDVATDPEIAKAFYPFSAIQGNANVFIFPSLNAANIGYKLLSRLGGATVIGPILVGMAKPVNILQHGADVDAIVNLAAFTAANFAKELSSH